MKVKFIGTTDMTSKGINLVAGGIYDLKPEVVEYLKKTFGNIEILEEAKTPKAKVEEVVEETKTTKK